MICPFCNIEHETTVPTVHLNGTNGGDLRDGLQAAVEAMREAQRRMVEAAPNGRDYYPQGDAALRMAAQHHARRCQDLCRILAELEEQRDHVQAVLDFKQANRRNR